MVRCSTFLDLPHTFVGMEGIYLVIEGDGLQPVLREMEQKHKVRVLGPDLSRNYLGSGVTGSRMVVKVDAESVGTAMELVKGFLPEDADFTVQAA
jgi:hypothetical protein